MSPASRDCGSVRSAAVVNEEIRTLVKACGGWLYGDARVEYERLVAEWALAVRAEIVEAA